MKLAKGWNFPDADEFMVGELAADGTYQSSHLQAALTHVTDWSRAIDGGAHVGTWSRLMAVRFDQVIAVEPSPDTFEALLANMESFACLSVDCRHVALGAAPGSISMTLDEKGARMANTGARFVHASAPSEPQTPLVTIDSWDLPSLGFLKLDIEGSEPAALMGARATLRRCKPIVLFENKYLWKRFGMPREAPQSLLKGLGYRLLETVSRDEIWGPA